MTAFCLNLTKDRHCAFEHDSTQRTERNSQLQSDVNVIRSTTCSRIFNAPYRLNPLGPLGRPWLNATPTWWTFRLSSRRSFVRTPTLTWKPTSITVTPDGDLTNLSRSNWEILRRCRKILILIVERIRREAPMTRRSSSERSLANQQRAHTLWAMVLVCVGCVPALAFGQSPNQRFGIISHWDGLVALKTAELGTGIVRVPCNWGDMEPSRGNFAWGCSDNAVFGANSWNVQVLLTVQCTPAWARLGGGCNTLPSNLADFYDFVAAFVQRYRGFNVILGIFNEPNLVGISASSYCSLYSKASAARNAFNPGFVLAGPETSHHAIAVPFFQRKRQPSYFKTVMGCMGSAMAAQDVVAVHWYPDGPPLPPYLDVVRSLVSVANGGWLSETGYSTPDINKQALFYAARMRDIETAGLTRPWWQKIIFYVLYDGVDCCTDAILYANFTNKPAFNTYAAWIAEE